MTRSIWRAVHEAARAASDIDACAAEVRTKLAQRYATTAVPGRGASVSAPADDPATPPVADGRRFPQPAAETSDACPPLASDARVERGGRTAAPLPADFVWWLP